MIVVVNGFPLSGKDEFVKFCILYLKTKSIKGYNKSSVDKVKKIAKEMGWDGNKDPKSRKYLSDIKDLYTWYCDGPTKDIIDFSENNDGIIFFHCREPKEIEKLVNKKIDTKTLLIRRFEYTTCDTNHADIYVEEYSYDYIIENIEGLDLLKKSAEKFIEDILYK